MNIELVPAPWRQMKTYTMWLGILIGTLDAAMLLVAQFTNLNILTPTQVLGINAVLGFLIVPAKLILQNIPVTTDEKIAVVAAAAAQPVKAGEQNIEVKVDDAPVPPPITPERLPMKHHLRAAQAAFLLLFTLAVLGCAQLGLASPQTVSEKALVATAAVDQVLKTTTTLLNARQIGSADAENVVKITDGASAGIAVARTVAAADPAAGQSRLTAVMTILTGLQTYLATKGATK